MQFNFVIPYFAFLLFILQIVFVPSAVGQQSEKCAFDQHLKQWQKSEVFIRNRQVMERYIQTFSQSAESRSTGTVKIPCVVHVIHTGQAIGTIDNDQMGNDDGANPNNAQINSAISDMTNAFKHTGPYASKTAYTASLDIEFVLASVAPDGTSTDGIIRYDVSGEAWGTDFANNGMDAGLSPGVPQATITTSRYWPPMDYMNIWLVHEIENNTTTLGFASFPNSTAGATDGLTMLATAFGYDPNCGTGSAIPGSILDCNTNLNGTANHETGHYLNLYHTFTGDMGGASCPANMTCGTDSDCCDDIDPHQRTSGCTNPNPPDPVTNTCVTPTGSTTYIHNFMDYADDACFHGFSENQKTRMEAALSDPRIALCNAISDDPPAANYPVTVAAPNVTNPDQTMGIYDITLDGTTFNSWSSNYDGGYVNRIASATRITLNFNTMYTMTVQVGVGNTLNDELISVFIDYDNDGSFIQAGDLIFQATSGKKNGEVFSFNFTTPSSGTPPPNQGLRLRVISDFDSGSPLGATHVSNNGGQIEDYTIVLTNPLPVELTEFRAIPKQDAISLKWETVSEINNKGFELERSTNNNTFQTIGWIESKDTSSSQNSYQFLNDEVEKGITYYYRLKQIDLDNTFNYSNIVSTLIPNKTPRLDIFPNPTTNLLNVHLKGSFSSDIEIYLMSTNGQLIDKRIIEANSEEIIEFNMSNLSNGIYFIRTSNNQLSEYQKVVLIK